MASEASVQQRNMESAVLFMQQDHSATLRALHEEIHKLQSKCTDLTFQLTMNGVDIEEGGDVDSRLTDIQKQLSASQWQKKQLESELGEQREREQQMTQELRSQKKRLLDERRGAEQALSGLQAEVEAKANNIAYLTSELHRLKLRTDPPGEEPKAQGPQRLNWNPLPPQHAHHMPTPPRDPLSNSARLRQQRGVGSHPRSGVRRVGTVGVARMGSASHPTPDITPFMQRDLEVGVAAEVRKPAAPLPPIAGSRLMAAGSGSGGREREVHRVLIASGAQLTRASVPEIATLAVDQINSGGGGGGAGWKRLPPPTQSHGCEHN